jgi:hypothetical protein
MTAEACFLTALGVVALVRSPAYPAILVGNPGFYQVFGLVMSVVLGAFLYANRANLWSSGSHVTAGWWAVR